jgi:hypothetical protein
MSTNQCYVGLTRTSMGKTQQAELRKRAVLIESKKLLTGPVLS